MCRMNMRRPLKVLAKESRVKVKRKFPSGENPSDDRKGGGKGPHRTTQGQADRARGSDCFHHDPAVYKVNRQDKTRPSCVVMCAIAAIVAPVASFAPRAVKLPRNALKVQAQPQSVRVPCRDTRRPSLGSPQWLAEPKMSAACLATRRCRLPSIRET